MKRALITSGGGAKGAFTVGALKKLQELGVNKYDIISGTSTGALIAALAAVQDIDTLVEVYLDVTNDDILRMQNIIANIIDDKPFIFDTDPLVRMIDKHVTVDVFNQIMAGDTILCLTAVSLQTGKITVFSTKDIPFSSKYNNIRITTHKELKEALLASGSQAGFLKPVRIQTSPNVFEDFVDGGNRDVIPSRVATDLEPDEVFVLSNNPQILFPEDQNYSKNSILNVILRAISVFIQDVRENDIAVLDEYGARTGARIFRIEPGEDLDPEHPTGLNFNVDSMMLWMGKGRRKAGEVFGSII